MKRTITHPNRVWPRKSAVSLDDLDFAACHGAREVFRDVLDHVLLARDQGGPVQLRLTNSNPVQCSAFNVVKRLSGRNQHLLWRTATVGTFVPPRSRASIIATDSP